MAKFFKRLGSKKERYLILMKILSLEIGVTEPVERISIEWRRGEKKSETSTIFDLSPTKHQTLINETFSKTSVFYFAPKTQTFFKKLAHIKVKGFTFGKERSLGECELDLSVLVGSQNQVKVLQLSKSPSKTARITLQISIVKEGESVEQLTDKAAEDSSSEGEDTLIMPEVRKQRALTQQVRRVSLEESKEVAAVVVPIAELEEEISRMEVHIRELEEEMPLIEERVE